MAGRSKWLSPMTVLGFFIVLLFAYLLLENRHATAGIETLENGWIFTLNNEQLQGQPGEELGAFVFPSIQKGDVFTLSRPFVEESAVDKLISFDTWHTVTNVYLEEELIYTWGEEYQQRGQMLGAARHNVQLPPIFEDKMLRIEFIATEDNPIANISAVGFYKAGDDGALWFGRPIFLFLIGSFVLLFGVAIIIIACALSNRNYFYYEPFFLGISVLLAGTYILCRGNFIQLLVADPQIYNVIEYISLFSISIPMLLYFRRNAVSCTRRFVRWTYYLCVACSCIFVAAALYINATTTFHLCSMLTVFYFLVLWVTVIQFYIYFDSLQSEDMQHKRIYFFGILTFVLGSIVSIICFRLCYNPFFAGVFQIWKWYNYILPLALSVLVIFFVAAFYVDMKRILDNSYRAEMLEYIVHYDALTQIYNRRSFDADMDQLAADQDAKYGMISADLNGLKVVNDTLGHQTGDEMIKAFANILSNCCGANSKTYRLGGDEFVAILFGADKNCAEKAIKQINREIEVYNNEKREFHLSVAQGIVLSGEAPSPQEAFLLADKRMYQNKQIMKGEEYQICRIRV